jgi:hypothetical protein
LSPLAAASELSWSGPAECNESEQLSFQVERALGAPLATTGNVHLQVHVERVEPDARALLRITGAAPDATAGATPTPREERHTPVKERLLVAPNCATLVDTLAVAITLAVEAALPPPARPPVASVSPEGSSVTAPRFPPAAADLAPSGELEARGAQLLPSVSAHAMADAGSLPKPALGFALGAQLGGARWQLQLLGTLWLEQRALLQPSSVAGAGADLQLATAALLGCANPLGSNAQPWSLGLCAGWEMGRLHGDGRGVTRPRPASALWLAPSLNLSLAWQVPATLLRLVARVGAALPLDRNEFVLERLGTVYQPASLSARASLGVDIAFE